MQLSQLRALRIFELLGILERRIIIVDEQATNLSEGIVASKKAAAVLNLARKPGRVRFGEIEMNIVEQ